MVDAAGDVRGTFSTLGQAIALARSELGAEISIDPSADLKPGDDGLSSRAYATGSFRYDDEDETARPHHLVYLKLTVPADAPWT